MGGALPRGVDVQRPGARAWLTDCNLKVLDNLTATEFDVLWTAGSPADTGVACALRRGARGWEPPDEDACVGLLVAASGV
eukprot:gene54245-6147_t